MVDFVMKKRRLKRLLLCIGMLSSIVGLVGTVVVSVEMTKYQISAWNVRTYLGIGLLSVSFFVMWIVFIYSAVTSRQFSIGPMAVCSNCLYAMIGASLVIVAHVLPVGTMFAFSLGPAPRSSFQSLDPGYRDSPLADSSNINSRVNASGDNDIDIEIESIDVIWRRVTTFGWILFGSGAGSALATLTIFCRLYSKHRVEEKRELERRKLSTVVVDTWKQKQKSARVSVYDYTAWDNRTKDLFREKNRASGNVSDGETNGRKAGLSTLESATSFIKTAVRFPKSPGKERHLIGNHSRIGSQSGPTFYGSDLSQ